MSENSQFIIETVVDPTGAREGMVQIAHQGQEMSRDVTQSANRAEAAIAGIGTGAATSSRNVEASQRSLIGSIQRATAAMEAGSRSGAAYFEVLGRQRGIDPNVLEPYLAQLRAVEAAQARAATANTAGAASLQHVGVSAAQTAAALRGVPAQITDIVTSIQGGQAPLTVFLQQGGQLRDTFGSFGGAARGLGSTLLGLINPLTVVGAAAAVGAVAYHQGSQEADAYRKALILTGNAAGTSAAQLSDMARSIGKSVGTQSGAAEVLATLAGTGRVAAADLKAFSDSAIRSQRDLGISAKQTAGDLDELGKAPVSALEKLNDQYHFLTPAIYAQVKALEEQGKTEAAAALAQRTYSEEFGRRAKEVHDNLGTLERAWQTGADKAKSWWDAVLDIGRPKTKSSEFEDISGDIAAKQARMSKLELLGPGKDNALAKKSLQDSIDQLKERQGYLQSDIRLQNLAGEAQANNNRVREAGLAFDKEGEKYQSRSEQLANAITAARNKGAEAGKSDAEIEKRVGEIRKSYADIYNDSIDSQIERLKRRGALEEALGQRALAQITAQRAAGAVSESEAIKLTAEVELKAFDLSKALLEKQMQLAKGKVNSLKEQADLGGQIAVVNERRYTRELQLENDLAAAARKRLEASDALYLKGIVSATGERDALIEATKASIEYNQEIGLSKTQVAALRAGRLENTAALKDESAAALEAIEPGSELAQTYREQAQALRDRATAITGGAFKEQNFEEWKKAVDTYGDVFRTGFADMLNNGKSGWQSFTKSLVTTFKTSVADQIYKMFLQPIVVQLVGNFVGQSGAASAVSALTSSGSAASGGNNAASLISMGKTIYSGFASGVSTTLGGYVSQLGTTFGSSAVSSSGAGMSMGPSGAAVVSKLAGGAAGATNGAAAAASTSAGASAGAYAIPIAGWIAAGMALSKGLRGAGWDATNGTLKDPLKLGGGIMAFDSILRGIGLSDSAANVFSGQATVARLLGRKAPKVEESGIEGTFGATGFDGDAYQNILEKGGVFRSDKRYTNKAALDAGTEGFFDGTIKNLMASVKGFGEVLGLPVTQIDGYTKAIKLTLTEDEGKNKEVITAVFGGIGDDLSRILVPTIAQFSKAATEFGGAGETASATLQRITTDYTVIDAALESIGDTFGAVGLESVSARERLLELSGGLEAFGKSTAYFAQNYLSEAERLAPVAKSVESALAALGLAGVTTRDQFKDVVLGLDLTSESGAKTYASLMGIQEQFAALHPAIDQVAEAAARAAQQQEIAAHQQEIAAEQRGLDIELMKALGNAEGALAEERKDALAKLMSDGARATQLAIYAVEDAAKTATVIAEQVAAAIAKAKESAAAQMDVFKNFGSAMVDTVTNAAKAAQDLRDFNNALSLGNLSALDPEQRYQEAKRRFVASDGTDTSAVTAFLQASKDRDADDFYYQRDFAAAQAKLTAGATAKDGYAAAVSAGWRSIREDLLMQYQTASMSAAPAMQTVLGPAQTYYQNGSSASVDASAMGAAIETMGTKLEAVLAVVADNTAKTTTILHQVTNGGAAILTEPA